MSEKETENVELETVIEEVVTEDSIIDDSVAVDVAPEAEIAPETEEPMPVVAENVVLAPVEPIEKNEIGFIENGVMGSTTVKVVPEKKKPAKPAVKLQEETVAVHSTRNVTWSGVGKVYSGYNIVTKEAAAQWLTRSHITLATPEDVAREFGK